MILAVDTCAWWSSADRDMLARASRQGHEVLIPSIVVAERARHLAREKNGMTPRQIADAVGQWVEQSGATVVPLDGNAVRRVVESWRAIERSTGVTSEAFWRSHARDVLIAASAVVAGAERLLTRNADDFARFRGRVALASPEDLARELGR